MNTSSSPRVWYLAYGANMASSVLSGRRKIHPVRQLPAILDDYSLSFDLLGVPYSKPALASLKPSDARQSGVPIHGLACLVSCADFERIVISEGRSGVQTSSSSGQDHCERRSGVRSLHPNRKASGSSRTMSVHKGLLVSGAMEHNLAVAYLDTLKDFPAFRSHASMRYHAGKWLFDLLWMRVQQLVQAAIKFFRGENGTVSSWLLVVFDILLWTMWANHDFIHSKL